MEFVKRHPLLTGFGILGVLVTVGIVVARATQSADDLTARALRNYRSGFLQQASSDIGRALDLDPDNEMSIVVGTTIYMSLNDLDQARELYARIETPRLLDHHMLLVDAAIRARQLEFAEQILNSAVARRADYQRARYLLLELYRLTYRSWDHRNQLLVLLQDRDPLRADVDFLFGMPDPSNTAENEFRDTTRDLNDPDHLIRLTACVNHIRYQEYDAAESALRQLTVERPDLIEAHSLLGRLLVHRAKFEELRTWFAALPPEALAHPDVCYSAGMLYEHLSVPEDAIAFFRHGLTADYRHRESLERIIALLEPANPPELETLRDALAKELELQALFQGRTPDAGGNTVDLEFGDAVLDLLEPLGWLPEALAWCTIFHGDSAATFQTRRETIEARLSETAGSREEASRDWPAIEPALRSVELAETVSVEWFAQRQAALRGE